MTILGCVAYNLGTGHGTSVLEMVSAFEKASGKVVFFFYFSEKNKTTADFFIFFFHFHIFHLL